MSKRIWFFILIVTVISCGVIERIKLRHNDEKREQGVCISLLNDYKFKDLENASYFSNTRVFISHVIFGDRYVYYIFWANGRCFFSTVRYIDGITVGNVLNDKSGTAGYYTINQDSLITERYADGVFMYDFYTLTENKLWLIGDKRREPFRKRMYNQEMLPNFWLEERYTKSGADSVYFNSDSVALWQPFW